MFGRIVSQLSLVPQAAVQLTAYARRLRHQWPVRSLITIAAPILLLLQLVVLIWPAQSNGTFNRLAVGPRTRQLEAASSRLPHLSTGWDLVIIIVICLLALWSQVRYRQLLREVAILRGDDKGQKS